MNTIEVQNKDNEKLAMIHSAFMISFSKDLWQALQSQAYTLIKGDALSVLAYNAPGKRIYGDLDILVERSNVKKIESICQEIGFTSKLQSRADRIFYLSASHQVAPLFRQTKGMLIDADINFDIFWGEYEGRRIDIAEFISDPIELSIYGQRIKSLPPIKAMIQLILHHYKDMNSIYRLATNNSIRYNMFKDIFYLWKNNQNEISLNKLYRLSEAYEIIPYVFYILYFTNCIFKGEQLAKYVEAFRTTEGEEILDCYGLSHKERRQWRYDFQTRLNTEDLYQLIANDLTFADIEKIEKNHKLFGGFWHDSGDSCHP